MDFSLTPNRNRSLVTLIILSAIFLGSIVIENPDLPFGICIFKTLTGIPCPSCGMTHSFVAIGHLKIVDGFYYNIIGPLLYLAMIFGIFIILLEFILDRLIILPTFNKYEKILFSIVIPLVFISWVVNLLKYFKLY